MDLTPKQTQTSEPTASDLEKAPNGQNESSDLAEDRLNKALKAVEDTLQTIIDGLTIYNKNSKES